MQYIALLAKWNRTYNLTAIRERIDLVEADLNDQLALVRALARGLSWVEAGGERGEALSKDYTTKRYHQPDDEYLPSWDFTGIARDAQFLHAVGRDLANSTDWPNWSADSEFRAIRDQSAGDRSGAVAPPPTTTPPAKGERG